MTTPQIDRTLAAELLTQAQQRALEVSRGQLTDVSPASPVTALLEATALIGSTVQNQVNQLAETVENNRIAAFGIDRIEGRAAVLTVEIRLQATYSEPFLLPTGYRFAAGGIFFETTEDAFIPALGETTRVNSISLVTGSQGNVTQNVPVAFTAVNRMAGIFLVEDARGGLDAESDDDWRARVYGTIRRRDTLISTADFEDYVRNYLGIGSVAIAIRRLKPDQTTFDNGFVGVFGLNSDGTSLTQAQISTLQDDLTRLAAMATVTVWSVATYDVSVDVVVVIQDAVSPATTANSINVSVSNYLRPGTLPAGEPILNKAVEYLVQQIDGVVVGALSVELNGFAAPAALPNQWTVARMSDLKITITNSGGASFEFEF